MFSAIYWIVITLATASFALISIVSKAALSRKGKRISYKSFLPVYLAFSSIFSVATTLSITRSLYIGYDMTLYAALVGFIYCLAAYFFFFSIEHEKAALVGTVNGSQFILLSFLSALLFLHSVIIVDSVASIVMFAGIVLLSISNVKGMKVSKYVFFALVANILWVIMWLIFYSTIPPGLSPLVYYSWLSIFTAFFSVLFSITLRTRGRDVVHYFRSKDIIIPVAFAGFFNGFGTVLFSLAYIFNSAYSPLISEISLPALVILSFIFLKERLKFTQIIGVFTVISSILLLFFL
ncbi:MAG: EamA family transporter [Candidatus Acidifodinimicrobium sp.]